MHRPAPTRQPGPHRSTSIASAGRDEPDPYRIARCPYAPTAAFCAEAIPVFCKGEASGNGITGEPAHLMPDASPLRAIQNRVGQRPSRLRVGTSPAPTRRPRRSVPRQSLFFVEAQCGASVAPTTWYTARYAAPRAPTTAICIHTPGFPLLTTRAAGV